ncbi:hypothetical protein GBAR_LOCUS19990 [Geodia barretti]|uniref:Uncharacterized protein n=1 Tax=Geodia barretti TaxID=519541 RepID=A0AA35X0S1_GEOBA|nr:hypothetical protein GBAR_LOCUS19990 [Geodia barretti]
MADTGGEPVEITSLRTNLVFITGTVTAVQGTLQWFANRLVEKSFIAQSEAQGILGTYGVPPVRQASQLMDAVFARIRFSDERNRLFLEFVSIFSHDAVYGDLVTKLRREVMTSSTSIPCSSSQSEVVHAHFSDRGSSTGVYLQKMHRRHVPSERLHKRKRVTEKRKKKGRLKVKHLPLLRDILKSVAHKFFVFGSEVKVEHDVLAGISKGYYTFDEKLSRVLEYRLQQAPMLTWHDIVRALRSPSVNEQDLASQIESQYIPCSSSQPVSDLSTTIDPSNLLVDMQRQHFLQQCHVNAPPLLFPRVLYTP